MQHSRTQPNEDVHMDWCQTSSFYKWPCGDKRFGYPPLQSPSVPQSSSSTQPQTSKTPTHSAPVRDVLRPLTVDLHQKPVSDLVTWHEGYTTPGHGTHTDAKPLEFLPLEMSNQVFGEDETDTCKKFTGGAGVFVTKRKSPQGNNSVKKMKCTSYVYNFPSLPDHLHTSSIITNDGGILEIPSVQANLVFHKGCVNTGSINASLSLCMNDFPPIQPDQILMSVVMGCGPSGEVFRKPVTLEVAHSANLDMRDELRKIQVWHKGSRNPGGNHEEGGPKWSIFFDGANYDMGSQIPVLVCKDSIRMYLPHFCDWAVLHNGPVDMVVLMMLKLKTLKHCDKVYIKVLILLEEYVENAVVEEEKTGWHVCSVSTKGVIFKVQNNGNPLCVSIFGVESSKWKDTQKNDVIPYQNLQTGRAAIEFSFRKKGNRPVPHIHGWFDICQDNNDFRVPPPHFDSNVIELAEDTNPPSNISQGYISASPAGMSSNPRSAQPLPSPGMSSNPGSAQPLLSPGMSSNPGSAQPLLSPGMSSNPGSAQPLPSVQSPSDNAGGSSRAESPGTSSDQGENQHQCEELPEKYLRVDVANQLGTEWERLATQLDFSAADIKLLRLNENNRGIKNVIFDMLCEWKQKQSLGTNLRRTLANALGEVERHDLANKICPQTLKGAESKSPSKDVDGAEASSSGTANMSASSSSTTQQESTDSETGVLVKFAAPGSNGYYSHHKLKKVFITEKQADQTKFYWMSSLKKGNALVINNSDFNNNIPRREESEIDSFNITYFLEQLGYDVEKRDDLKAQGINLAIKNFLSTCNQYLVTSCVIVLMSYGNSELIYGVDMKTTSLSKLLKRLNDEPGLKYKPKLCLYQADQLPSTSRFFKQDQQTMSSILTEIQAEDTFVGYMSTNGAMPLRTDQRGSAFVQAVCEVGFANADTDPLDEICEKMDKHIRSMRGDLNLKGADGVDQLVVPEWVTKFMTKKLYFLPGFEVMDLLPVADPRIVKKGGQGRKF